jgi:hypothetical protein
VIFNQEVTVSTEFMLKCLGQNGNIVFCWLKLDRRGFCLLKLERRRLMENVNPKG